jgi:hypothetical protein
MPSDASYEPGSENAIKQTAEKSYHSPMQIWEDARKAQQNASNAFLGADAPIVINERGGQQSETGTRFDLIDAAAERVLAEVLHYGAQRYSPNNWRKIDVDSHLNHLLNHVNAFRAGDRQDDHLGHAYCRAMMALAVMLAGGPLEDIPDEINGG